ncbi:MAG: zinc-dependent metalloprotease [Wenzhouxiangellaceae bacterium]|nr:zinc-dependent metalloprotease [Wenzhouxiangellaceae bacterium]MBS3823094.1 zinc-dependent metalloprotease [Wenzhouxiangellaceae bacterium]
MLNRAYARLLPILLLALSISVSSLAEENSGAEDARESLAEATEGLALSEGFIDIYSSAGKGRVLALLPAGNPESAVPGVLLRFIHAQRLTAGLGSNPLGLDRGWGNSGRILRFRRIGQRVIAEVENHRYRAVTDNALEREAVDDSFASSFVWSTGIVAEDDGGRVLIDLAGLLTADALGLAQTLGRDGGKFSRAADRSVPDAGSVLVFPDNVEIDAWITFTGDEPGSEVRATAADANAVTLVQHHSFVRLPNDGYRVRRADPRTGTFTLGFYDYAAELAEPVIQGYAMRHRLQHHEPGRPESGVREPLVFHIDPGAPERIQQALLDGASWWSEAFAAAGFADGFRVELLPEDAHPLDIRYNVVQWVHRQTRGWSYGGGIVDPRTGEMIKGHVILGSQRVRQDRMIFEGLAGVDAVGSGSADDPIELALDRIRQLAAHELGHALGFGHNFAASANDRASVMDYPAPWVGVDGSTGLDFSRAYDHGIGEWDKLTARWLYSEFAPDADEAARLNAIVADGIERRLHFVADRHARSVSTGHPEGAVWDNGNDAVAELGNVLEVRARALADFGADRIAEGRPLASLREVLVPIYLYHRYQVDAAAKSLGGARFSYARRGGPGDAVSPVAPADQRRALEMLLETLNPVRLDLRDKLVDLMPPAYSGYWFNAGEETLPARTDPVFDLFTAAESAADITLAALFDAARAERLAAQAARTAQMPSLTEVIVEVRKRLFDDLARADSPRLRVISGRLISRYATALMQLEAGGGSAEVQVAARTGLLGLARQLGRRRDMSDFNEWMTARIEKHLERPAPPDNPVTPGPGVPPGSPIGGSSTAGSLDWVAEECWHCYD